jgi:hypothetical protein
MDLMEQDGSCRAKILMFLPLIFLPSADFPRMRQEYHWAGVFAEEPPACRALVGPMLWFRYTITPQSACDDGSITENPCDL